MDERTGVITFQGNPLTLIGKEVIIGDTALDFVVIDNAMTDVKFSSFRGKTVLISSVPSLDTPVCDMETMKFNDEAGKFGSDIVILTISMDLPFAQTRWCQAKGVSHVKTLSDHRDADFGNAYGVLIKELRLLARALFVVDSKGIIQYIQLVKDIANEPDYSEVLSALEKTR